MESGYASKLFIAFLVLLAGCEGNIDSLNNYPTELAPLSGTELTERTNEFHALSEGRICSELNQYGYTIASDCLDLVKGDTPLTKFEAIEILRSELQQYLGFTNLSESSNALLLNVRALPGSEDAEWRIRTSNQKIHDVPVRDTQVTFWLTKKGIYRIGGHWYPTPVIPQNPVVSRHGALDLAHGHIITYSDSTGKRTVIIESDDLPSPADLEQVVISHQKGDRLQFRTTWRIPIGQEHPWLNLYVDAMENRIIDEEMLIDF